MVDVQLHVMYQCGECHFCSLLYTRNSVFFIYPILARDVPQPYAVREYDLVTIRINQPFVVANKGKEEARLRWRKLDGCHQVMNLDKIPSKETRPLTQREMKTPAACYKK